MFKRTLIPITAHGHSFMFGVARGYGYISISDETTQHASLIPAINNGLTYL